jgi:site-specific DNA-methyltransferase (adenine-specific)
MQTLECSIAHGDCIELMRQMPSGCVDLAFADPPFNIGYDYDEYDDRHNDEDYLDWSRQWMEEIHRLLKPDGTFWLAIGDEYAADLKVIADRQIGFTMRSWVVWYYTFGVNCRRKFNRSHVHLFHFVKDPDAFTFNFDDPEIRVPSARALVYGDKRANPKGRLPDDTWMFRPQDFQSDAYGFSPADDTWYFARVAGTFKERQGFHGCQMPEQLLGRIIRASSNAGDVVFDPFVGSGTTLAVAKKLGRQWLGTEMSSDYVRYASERIEKVEVGSPLDGPADPVASAPATGNGRRLAGWEQTGSAAAAAAQPPSSAVPIVADAATDVVAESPVAVVDTPPPSPEPPAAEHPAASPPSAAPKATKPNLRELQRQILGQAYLDACDGYSVDRLVADPDLQTRFHDACRAAGLLGDAGIWNRELMRLRKSGKLPKPAVPQSVTLGVREFDSYRFAAEIAWRLVADKHAGVALDHIFCDPALAAEFDRHASRFCPDRAAVDLRWAALYLRKSQHTLDTEVHDYHYVFATREFDTFRKPNIALAKQLAGEAGVYMLCGARRAPLYVGDTLDLGARLVTHLAAPGTRRQVVQIATLADDDLPNASYREPLKVALARRWQTQWNVC